MKTDSWHPRKNRTCLRESSETDDIQVTIPFELYRQLQWFLRAIDSSVKPDDLIADIIPRYLHRLDLVGHLFHPTHMVALSFPSRNYGKLRH